MSRRATFTLVEQAAILSMLLEGQPFRVSIPSHAQPSSVDRVVKQIARSNGMSISKAYQQIEDTLYYVVTKIFGGSKGAHGGAHGGGKPPGYWAELRRERAIEKAMDAYQGFGVATLSVPHHYYREAAKIKGLPRHDKNMYKSDVERQEWLDDFLERLQFADELFKLDDPTGWRIWHGEKSHVGETFYRTHLEARLRRIFEKKKFSDKAMVEEDDE